MKMLKATVATLVAGAMGLAGVGSAMAADTRVDESKLGDGAAARQTLTVAANGDISNRTLKAVPLAYYSYACRISLIPRTVRGLASFVTSSTS